MMLHCCRPSSRIRFSTDGVGGGTEGAAIEHLPLGSIPLSDSFRKRCGGGRPLLNQGESNFRAPCNLFVDGKDRVFKRRGVAKKFPSCLADPIDATIGCVPRATFPHGARCANPLGFQSVGQSTKSRSDRFTNSRDRNILLPASIRQPLRWSAINSMFEQEFLEAWSHDDIEKFVAESRLATDGSRSAGPYIFPLPLVPFGWRSDSAHLLLNLPYLGSGIVRRIPPITSPVLKSLLGLLGCTL